MIFRTMYCCGTQLQMVPQKGRELSSPDNQELSGYTEYCCATRLQMVSLKGREITGYTEYCCVTHLQMVPLKTEYYHECANSVANGAIERKGNIVAGQSTVTVCKVGCKWVSLKQREVTGYTVLEPSILISPDKALELSELFEFEEHPINISDNSIILKFKNNFLVIILIY